MEVDFPTLSQLGQDGTRVPVAYDERYLAEGFRTGLGKNDARLLLTISGGKDVDLSSSERTGALVNPSFRAEAFSTSHGVVGGRETYAAAEPKFDPTAVFAGFDRAKVLGSFTLAEIALPVGMDNPEGALRMFEREGDDGPESHVEWRTQDLRHDHDILELRPTSELVVAATFAAGKSDVEARLTDFVLHLLSRGDAEFLRVDIGRLVYRSSGSASPTIDLEVGTVEFLGPLKFVKALADFLNPGEGFDVRTTPSSLVISTGVTLPSLEVGVFTLSNLSFGAAIEIPYQGDGISLLLNVGTPDAPFTLSIGPFGGSGYLLARLGSDPDLSSFEVELAFGGHVALNVGVASGGVSVVVGIHILKTSTALELTGFARLRGELDVLGVICMSLTFEMSLTYVALANGTDKVRGRASLTVEVDVAFISASVTIEVERSFGNAPADPTFADQLAPADWDQYCNAFAGVA
jgi:hypothetical protein